MLILGTTKVPVFISFVNLISAAIKVLGMVSLCRQMDFLPLQKCWISINEKSNLVVGANYRLFERYIVYLIMLGGLFYSSF